MPPVRVTLVDEDGRRLWGAAIKLTAPNLPPGVFSHIDQIIAFRDLVFTHRLAYGLATLRRALAEEGAA